MCACQMQLQCVHVKCNLTGVVRKVLFYEVIIIEFHSQMQYYDVELISSHFNKCRLIFPYLPSVVLILAYNLRSMKLFMELRLLCPSVLLKV